MVDKEYVRKLYFLQEWSIRKISRHLEISRQTVRKMLKDGEIPKYNLQKPRPFPVMEPYLEIITYWLELDKKAPVKQRHTATRIYERLKEEYGFTGGASTVRRFVKMLKQSIPECFIPLEAAPGEQAQVDFGHAQVILAGKATKVCLFCMRLKYSGVPFVIAFPNERLEAFLEGHVQAFSYFNGIPKEGMYDNATTQVVKILAGPLRQEHEWFSSLRAHYLFNSSFCHPARGNEKGSVENLVKYVRLNALVPVPSFNSMEELNHYLLQWCRKEQEKHQDKWLEEKANLRPLPLISFCAARPQPAKVSSYSLVTVDRNRYSVPCRCVGRNLVAKVYVDKVDILDREKLIASHKRCYGRSETILKLEHYLPALERKPHAVTHATVVRKLPPIFQELREQMVKGHGYKDFLAVLLLVKDYSLEEVTRALQELGTSHINASILKQHLSNHRTIDNPLPPVDRLITVIDTKVYDNLMGEAVAR